MGWVSMMEDFEKIRSYNNTMPHHSLAHECSYIKKTVGYVKKYASDPKRVKIYRALQDGTTVSATQPTITLPTISNADRIRKERAESLAMQKALNEILDTLQLKQKLLTSASTLHSSPAKFIITRFGNEVQASMSIVNDALNSLQYLTKGPKSTIRSSDRITEKKILIYQLVHEMTEMVNNSDMIPIRTVKEISKDISSLAAWFYDDHYIFCNVGALSCSEDTAMKYLKEEMEYTEKSCEICDEPTVMELDYCINCGYCIRGERND